MDLLTLLEATTSVAYTFTTQKNGNRNGTLIQGLISDPWSCPIKAIVRHVLLHHTPVTPLASFYRDNHRMLVNVKDVRQRQDRARKSEEGVPEP
jgi:hypothetical protein